MGVVQVDRNLICQVSQTGVLTQVAANQILHRCGNKKILLLQTKLPACGRAVIGVQNPGDVFVFVFGCGSTRVVTCVEGSQVDVRWGHGFPQTQGTDFFSAMTRDDHVIGFGIDFTRRLPHSTAITVFNPTAKTHRIGDIGPRELPWRTVF